AYTTEAQADAVAQIVEALGQAGCDCEEAQVSGEPSPEVVDGIVGRLRGVITRRSAGPPRVG
ncbi:MAG: hypothetical protein ACOC02_04640, partial [Guyparkeria sp.]